MLLIVTPMQIEMCSKKISLLNPNNLRLSKEKEKGLEWRGSHQKEKKESSSRGPFFGISLRPASPLSRDTHTTVGSDRREEREKDGKEREKQRERERTERSHMAVTCPE